MKKFLTGVLILACLTATAQLTNYTALDGPFVGTPSKIISGTAKLIGISSGLGIVVSADAGATWSVSNSIITNFFPNDIYRDAVSGKIYVLFTSQLYSSVDDGTTWTLVANTGFASGLRFLKGTTHFFIVGSNRIVYRSLSGTSWSQINNSIATGNIEDFQVAPNGYLYISGSGLNGIYRSTNNGLNFNPLGNAEGLTNTNVRSVAFNGTTVYALSEVGPFKSTSNGDTWTNVTSNITPVEYFDYFSFIEKDPSGNMWIFDNPKIWKSSDAGTSWTGTDSPVALTNIALTGAYFSSATQFFVGAQERDLYKTTDGGASWSSSNSGLTAFVPFDIKLTSTGRILISPGNGIGVRLSIDNGLSWDDLYTDPLNTNVSGFSIIGSTIYGYGSRLVRSDDNGSVWTTVADRSVYNLVTSDGITFYNFTTDYSVNPPVYALEKSINNGVDWVATNTKPLTGMTSPNASYLVDRDNSFIAGSGNLFTMIFNYGASRYELYKIDPATGAATYVSNFTGSLQDIDYTNGKLYALTSNGKVNVSSDEGATWFAMTLPFTGYARIRAISDNTLYALNKSVYLSNDAGLTWTNTGTVSTLVRDIAISTANYSYFITEYGRAYRSNLQVVPPAAPSGLVSVGYDRNSIGLLWNDNSTTEDYFIIEASEGNNLNYDSATKATRPSSYARSQGFSFLSSVAGVTLKPSTTYFLRVRASGSGGKSSPSNEISVTTSADCSTTSVFPQNRSWTASTLGTSGVGPFTVLNQTLTGSNGLYFFDDLPLGASIGLLPKPPDPFNVSVEENCGSVFLASSTAYISNGNGTWNPTTHTLTIPWQTHPLYPLRTETTVYALNATDPIPGDPQSLTATTFLPATILLNWFSGDFAAETEVERSTISGSGFTKIATMAFPKISYIDNDPALVLGATYYYRVRSKNSSGASAYTAEVTAIPASNYRFMPFDNLPAKIYSRSGGGGAWGDVDGDGINDLALPILQDSLGLNSIPPIIFKGLGNGQFTKYPIAELVGENTDSRSINIIDINNDGLNDLYISRASAYDLILIKKSDGTYTKTELTNVPTNSKAIVGASWADYDKDGDLDLLATSRIGFNLAPDVFLFNNDGSGALTRVTTGELVTDFGHTGDAEWADYDNDGDQDVIVVNQSAGGAKCRLYTNNGDGTFTHVLGSAIESPTTTINGRSASWGDYDNDGDLDVFITSFNLGGRLFNNQGDGTFVEVLGSAVTDLDVGFAAGSGWADLDNDQDLDLIVSGTSPGIYYNDGSGTFTKYTSSELANTTNLNKFYGIAFEDVDNDGFLDFLYGGFSNPDISNVIFRNTTPATASTKWLKINLKGTTSNKSAVGARLTLTAGSKTQIRELQSHTGHTSQSSPTQHFGLGSNATATTLVIKWPSGIVQTLTNVAANQTLTITEDGAGPAASTLLPANAAIDVASTTKLEITLNKAATAVSGKNIKLVKTSDPTTIVFTADVTSAVKTGNLFSFTIPTKLALATAYQVSVDAGAFIDIFSNPSLAIAPTSWSFTTLAGPVSIALLPVHNSTTVAVNTTIEITFDKTVTAVAGKKIQLKDGATLLIDADVSTTGSISGLKYILTPATSLPSLKLLEVIVQPGAFIDANQNDFPGIATGQWTFTTSDSDLAAPTITYDPTDFSKLEKGFTPKTLTITATDNKAVTSAVMYHRKISEKNYTPTNLTLNAGGKWETIVGSTFADEMGFEYYFIARDAFNNKGRSPSDSTRYASRVTLTNNNEPQISLPGGATLNSWKVISIPHDVSNTQIESIFSALGVVDNTKWKLLRYSTSPSPDGSWVEYPTVGLTNIERGKGYFINTKDLATITLSNPTAPSNTRDNLFSISLVKGWNQIGNPYTTPIKWSEAIAFNNATGTVQALKTFTGGTYIAGDELTEFQGGFVYATSDISNFKIPFKGQTLAGGRVEGRTYSSSIDEQDWRISFKLGQDEVTNELGAVGMSPDAMEGFDEHDDVTPPRFFDYLELSFGHPEHFAKKFSRDVVPTQDEYTWEFSVDSNLHGPAELTWENSAFGNSDKDLFLLDIQTQTLVNMRETARFSFIPRESGKFKLFFGTNLEAKIKPNRVLLGKAYPNPATGMTTIPFSLPDQRTGYQVSLEVYDMTGKKVNTIINGIFSSGFYSSEWDASLGSLSSGIYTYRLAVSSSNGSEVQSGKVMIRK